MTCERSPEVAWQLQFFANDGHLPPDLREVSAACGDLARTLADFLPDNPELVAGLKALRQAKDHFVCAVVAARKFETEEI